MEIYWQWAGVLVCLAGLWSVNSQMLSQEQLQRIAQMVADQQKGTGNGGEISSSTESPGTDPPGENATDSGVPNLSEQDLQQIADMVVQILAEDQPAQSCPQACRLACRCGHMLDNRGCAVCRCKACLRPRPRRRLCPLGFIPSRRRCNGSFSRRCGSGGVCYAQTCCRRPRQSRGFSGMTSLRRPFSRTRQFRLTNRRRRLGNRPFRRRFSGNRRPRSFRRFASRSVG